MTQPGDPVDQPPAGPIYNSGRDPLKDEIATDPLAPRRAQAGFRDEEGAGKPTPRNKTGWIVVLAGLGCLLLVIIALVLLVVLGFWGYRSKSVAVAPPRTVVVPPGTAGVPGAVERHGILRALPYAEDVTSWSWSANAVSVPGGNGAFEKAAQTWVFTHYGQQASDAVGTILSSAVDADFDENELAGTVTITLGGDAKQAVVEAAFIRTPDDEWSFTFKDFRAAQE